MKRIAAVIISLAVLFTLSACQPTPQKATVAQKDSERLIEQAQKNETQSTDNASAESTPQIPLRQQYGIPETYTYDAQGADGLLNISVDAQVSVPQGAAMPIYRVQQAEFSQGVVSAFFDALCGDAEMWIYSGQRTKADIETQILNVRQRLVQIENDPSLSDELDIATETLARLEIEIQTAPDTIVEERADGTLEQMSGTRQTGGAAAEIGTEEDAKATPSYETFTYMGLNAYERDEQSEDGRGRSFTVRNNDNPGMSYGDGRNTASGINFGSSSSLPVQGDADIDAQTLSKIGIMPSEARQMVQELLDKTNSGMQVDSVYLQDDEQLGNYDDEVRPAERYAYKVYCVREIEGLRCSFVQGSSRPGTSDMMAPSWVYEEMYFMVNSEGIFRMMWQTPIEVVETVNEDAQLKPFSEIREIFEKMMRIEYEAQAEYGGSEYDFDISRVTLSLHRIIEKNNNESGLLIPAWNFYGKLTVGTDGPGGRFEKLGESFMTINAIDGSIIDISKGY